MAVLVHPRLQLVLALPMSPYSAARQYGQRCTEPTVKTTVIQPAPPVQLTMAISELQALAGKALHLPCWQAQACGCRTASMQAISRTR